MSSNLVVHSRHIHLLSAHAYLWGNPYNNAPAVALKAHNKDSKFSEAKALISGLVGMVPKARDIASKVCRPFEPITKQSGPVHQPPCIQHLLTAFLNSLRMLLFSMQLALGVKCGRCAGDRSSPGAGSCSCPGKALLVNLECIRRIFWGGQFVGIVAVLMQTASALPASASSYWRPCGTTAISMPCRRRVALRASNCKHCLPSLLLAAQDDMLTAYDRPRRRKRRY